MTSQFSLPEGRALLVQFSCHGVREEKHLIIRHKSQLGERLPGNMNPTAAHHSNEGADVVQQRYNRIAPIYDSCEWFMEYRVRRWRRDIWERIRAGLILEVGVGTGKNVDCYPRAASITAIDLSQKMLERARNKAGKRRPDVEFRLADVQHLPYPDRSFDAAVATFVFCSVPDPIQGLREVRRVLKPGGRILLLEHVLSRNFLLRPLMKSLDPIPTHIWGAHIDRDTLSNVRAAGFIDVREASLLLDIVKRIEAIAPTEQLEAPTILLRRS